MTTEQKDSDSLSDSVFCEDHKPLSAKAVPPLKKDATAKKAGKSLDKKRTWKKPKGKPKRPLSAYNFFFQDEREKIVAAVKMSDALITASLDKTTNAKQANRKPRGKIGFANLARNIAAKWKVLDESSKCQYEVRAEADKERYIAELTVWNEKQKEKIYNYMDEDLAIPKCKNHTSAALSHISSNSQPPFYPVNYNANIKMSAPPSNIVGMMAQNYPSREDHLSNNTPYMTYSENSHVNHYNSLETQRTKNESLIDVLHSATKMSRNTLAHETIQTQEKEWTNQQVGNIHAHVTCDTRSNSFSGSWGKLEPCKLVSNCLAHAMGPKLPSQPPSHFSEPPTMQPPLAGQPQHQLLSQCLTPGKTSVDPGLLQQAKSLTPDRISQPLLTSRRQIAGERYLSYSSDKSNTTNHEPPSDADDFQDDFLNLLAMISSDKL